MGTAPEQPEGGKAHNKPSIGAHRRHGAHSQQPEQQQQQQQHGKSKDADDAALAPMGSKDVAGLLGPETIQELTDADIDKVINGLPSWQSQLSLRGYIVGAFHRAPRAHTLAASMRAAGARRGVLLCVHVAVRHALPKASTTLLAGLCRR